MTFFIGILTAILILDCLLLILLVLVQLPKKEAGAGLAFGAGAADALFGAGAGNPLTKITKYAAGTFFGLLLVIALLQKSSNKGSLDEFRAKLDQQAKQSAAPAPGSAPAGDAPAGGAPAVNLLTPTNAPAPTVDTTNAAPK
jgi:protein translocase SecG subunit